MGRPFLPDKEGWGGEFIAYTQGLTTHRWGSDGAEELESGEEASTQSMRQSLTCVLLNSWIGDLETRRESKVQHPAILRWLVVVDIILRSKRRSEPLAFDSLFRTAFLTRKGPLLEC
jgi:hypothetical protein